MTHVITSLCLRDGGCIAACPVECIVPGQPQDEWPIFFIDPVTCIDCGACIPVCPVGAIFSLSDVPSNWQAKGGEVLNGKAADPLFPEPFSGFDYEGNLVTLDHTRTLIKGEIIDLTPDIQANKDFFDFGPGYEALG